MFKGVDHDDVHAEQFEELPEEVLSLGLFVVGVLPALGKRRRRLAYFVPRFHFRSIPLLRFAVTHPDLFIIHSQRLFAKVVLKRCGVEIV